MLDWMDESLLQPISVQSSMGGGHGFDPGSFTLDTSLERVFGQGATRLAIEFEGGETGKSGESEVSSLDFSSDSDDVDATAISTPARDDLSKKRARGGTSFGNLSGISDLKAKHELSSLSESSDSSEIPDIDAKKLKLAREDLEEGSDFADPLGVVSIEMNGGVLASEVELHEEVPLEDPGPSTDEGGKFSPEGTF